MATWPSLQGQKRRISSGPRAAPTAERWNWPELLAAATMPGLGCLGVCGLGGDVDVLAET